MQRLLADPDPKDGRVLRLDGLRLEFADGWGLVRASNTTPCLTLRFEADTPEALARVQALFRDRLRALDPALALPF
jgi:phosphomannomutase/phosphoglucomutase